MERTGVYTMQSQLEEKGTFITRTHGESFVCSHTRTKQSKRMLSTLSRKHSSVLHQSQVTRTVMQQPGEDHTFLSQQCNTITGTCLRWLTTAGNDEIQPQIVETKRPIATKMCLLSKGCLES